MGLCVCLSLEKKKEILVEKLKGGYICLMTESLS